MSIRLIQVPYDSGARNRRLGRGPLYFIENGLLNRLPGPVTPVVVESPEDFPKEVSTGFELMRGVAREVRAAATEGAFPLVVAGNCNTTVGALGGLSATHPGIGLVWFDAHGEFNTPETTTTGFLDGMGLAIATGHCWKPLASSIPGFEPVPDQRVILAGVRDLDPAEVAQFDASDITVISADTMRRQGAATALQDALKALAQQASALYIHIDLDVHDPALAPVNPYKPEGGLAPAELQTAVRAVTGQLPLAGATVAAYDPDADVAHRGLDASLDLIELLHQVGSKG
jgi:arginase